VTVVRRPTGLTTLVRATSWSAKVASLPLLHETSAGGGLGLLFTDRAMAIAP